MTEPESERPKIIVDEGWKAQVEAEKEAADKATEQPATAADQEDQSPPTDMPIPEASFSLLATNLATQALVAMGQVRVPDQEEASVNLDLAKHCIDTLDILEQKTKGNLTPDENSLLSGLLHESRMLFVAVQTQAQADKT